MKCTLISTYIIYFCLIIIVDTFIDSESEFNEKWEFEIVNFVKNENLKWWILWKMRHRKNKFCQKWDFQNVIFVKNETLKLFISEKWDFENVNFVKSETLKMWILIKVRFSKCEFLDKLRIFAPAPSMFENFLLFS